MRLKRSQFTISGRTILMRIKNIFRNSQEGTVSNKEQIQLKKEKNILAHCLSNYATWVWILQQKVISKDCYSLLFFFKILKNHLSFQKSGVISIVYNRGKKDTINNMLLLLLYPTDKDTWLTRSRENCIPCVDPGVNYLHLDYTKRKFPCDDKLNHQPVI